MFADEHPHPIYFLLFSVSCLPQHLMLECLPFSLTSRPLTSLGQQEGQRVF